MSTALVAAPSGLPRLDSKTILEQKGKLDAMVENAKQQILDLKEDIQSGGGPPTPEQKSQMSYYMEVLKNLDKEQRALAQRIEQAELKQQERHKRAREKREAKEPPPVYMYELRAMNQKVLTKEDRSARRSEAQKITPVIPSGGFTGFRVAPDICNMDFSYLTPDVDDSKLLWKGDGAIIDIKNRKRRH